MNKLSSKLREQRQAHRNDFRRYFDYFAITGGHEIIATRNDAEHPVYTFKYVIYTLTFSAEWCVQTPKFQQMVSISIAFIGIFQCFPANYGLVYSELEYQ